ncbi:MAG: pyridoxamine 5'-phosphate oxidase family protein [Actinomycetota bacterium]|nr:MAG: pyridoxamine 5'-phosphate oxidase family protein [Actinomycetota bacterium]
MGIQRPELTNSQIEFIKGSPLYFVASAPSGSGGHINCSPRPVDWSFFIDSPKRVGWLDLVGSGIETIAHIKENGRIVLMFCSFGPKPLILRLHGRGVVHEPADEFFDGVVARAGKSLGIRAVVAVDIERVSTSCGYGVPLMEFVGNRSTIDEWIERKGQEGLADYRKNNNLASIDGLTGLDVEKIC